MRKNGIVIAVIFVWLCWPRISGTSPQKNESADRDSAWTQIGPSGGDIRGLARNPKLPNELYAVSSYGQVFRSTTNGASWTRTVILNSNVIDVAVSPISSTTVYVLGGNALYKSANKGATFTQLSFDFTLNAYSGKMAVHPTDPKTIYVYGTYDSNQNQYMAVLKTVDGGNSWSLIKLDGKWSSAWGRDIVISPKNPAAVFFCGCYNNGSDNVVRVYRSLNSGGTWKNISPGFLNGKWASVEALAVDPNDPGKVFLCCRSDNWSGIAQTSNSGSSWTKQITPSYIDAYTVIVDKKKPGTLYAGGYSQNSKPTCFMSIDDGNNWTELQTGLYGKASDILVSGSTIHFASTAGIFKSTNGGVRFKTSHKNIKATLISSFALAASASGARVSAARTIYAAAYGFGIFKSTNGGGSWAKLRDFLGSDNIIKLVVPDSDPNRIYISTQQEGNAIYRSVDGGKNFKSLLPPEGCEALTLVVDDAKPDFIIAAGYIQNVMGIILSTDGGLKWKKIKIRNDQGSLAMTVTLNPSNPNIIYVGGIEGNFKPALYKSTNRGASWSRIATPSSTDNISSLVLDPNSRSIIYAGTGSNGIYKSMNGGSSWKKLTNAPWSGKCIAINPSNSNEVFAGGFGLFYSSDGGMNWTDLSEDLPTNSVIWIEVDSAERKIYVGTGGGGICRRSF